MITHNDARRHWRGDHVDPSRPGETTAKIRAAIAEYRAAKGGYIDVHAWQFTPESFRGIMTELSELGLSPYHVEAVFQTPAGRQEFTAILSK